MRRGISLLVLLGTCLCGSDYELADAGGWKKLYKHGPGYSAMPGYYPADPMVYGPAWHGPFAPLVAHYYGGYPYGGYPGCSLPACSLPVCSMPACSIPACSLPVCSLPACSMPLTCSCSCACSAPVGGVGSDIYVPQSPPSNTSPTPATPTNPGTTYYVPPAWQYQNPALVGATAVTAQPQITAQPQMLAYPQNPAYTQMNPQHPQMQMQMLPPSPAGQMQAVPQMTAVPQLTVIPQSHSYYAPLAPLVAPIPAVPAVEEIAW